VAHASPAAAFRRSLLLPGWGQFTNHRPVKGLIYGGIVAASVGMAVRNWHTAIGYDGPGSIFWSRRGWTDGRNNWLILGGAAYILAAVDAYVDAHLRTYDVSPVALRLAPRPDGGVLLAAELPLFGRRSSSPPSHGRRGPP